MWGEGQGVELPALPPHPLPTRIRTGGVGAKSPAPPKKRGFHMNLNWILRRLLEVALGAIFFYAGWQKHLHPYEFAEAVLAYRLLPDSLVGVAAGTLPWLEMAAGLFLVLGLKKRSCLLLLGLMASLFMVIMLLTLARGLKIDCGCGLFFPRQVGLAVVAEDAFFLLWAAGLYWWEWQREAGEAVVSLSLSRP